MRTIGSWLKMKDCNHEDQEDLEDDHGDDDEDEDEGDGGEATVGHDPDTS